MVSPATPSTRKRSTSTLLPSRGKPRSGGRRITSRSAAMSGTSLKTRPGSAIDAVHGSVHHDRKVRDTGADVQRGVHDPSVRCPRHGDPLPRPDADGPETLRRAAAAWVAAQDLEGAAAGELAVVAELGEHQRRRLPGGVLPVDRLPGRRLDNPLGAGVDHVGGREVVQRVVVGGIALEQRSGCQSRP